MVGVSKRSISLEDYVDFYLNPQQHFLNKHNINQVLSMHGFLKLDHVPNAAMVEELKTVTLESPFRSTLKENNISSSSLLNPDEIKQDLATLRWNEWSIDSVQIHRSGPETHSPGEEYQYSIKFLESEKSSSSKKTEALNKNKKGLTDISNLPAANLNSSNSKQIQAKKKISPGSDNGNQTHLLLSDILPTIRGTNCVKPRAGSDFLFPLAGDSTNGGKFKLMKKKGKSLKDTDLILPLPPPPVSSTTTAATTTTTTTKFLFPLGVSTEMKSYGSDFLE